MREGNGGKAEKRRPSIRRTGEGETGKEQPAIELRELSVGYRGRALLEPVNLKIEPGEIVTLIGPNGSGKSTVLRSVIGQLRLLSGRVLVAGRELGELSLRERSKKQASLLTEQRRTELMSCFQVAAAGRYPHTGRLGLLTEQDRRKVKAALLAVHADSFADRDFNHISDGQRQRVLLARAICQEPEIIVLDEPTSFLDIHYKLELLSILRRLAKEEGITILMSLHEIDLAMKISDRILCVDGKKVWAAGAPETVLDQEGIQRLYRLEAGYFDLLLGSMELPAPKGEAKTFVISSGGSGIPVYRRLQRENRPFIAGILYPNDLDYRVAKLLAAEVIEEQPFFRIGTAALHRAMQRMECCETVIDAGFARGPMNRRLEELLLAAKRQGKLHPGAGVGGFE